MEETLFIDFRLINGGDVEYMQGVIKKLLQSLLEYKQIAEFLGEELERACQLAAESESKAKQIKREFRDHCYELDELGSD